MMFQTVWDYFYTSISITDDRFRFYGRGYISWMCAHRGKGYEVVPLIQLYNKPIEQKKDEMKRDIERVPPPPKKKIKIKKILPQQFFSSSSLGAHLFFFDQPGVYTQSGI